MILSNPIHYLVDHSSPKLVLTGLNSSRSAYASFTLDRYVFFERYNYSQTASLQPAQDDQSKFTCQVLNKVRRRQKHRNSMLSQDQALLSVFKARLGDTRDEDTAVEKCEVSIQDQAESTECRIIVKMICRHGKHAVEDIGLTGHELNASPGVTKTYKLTYEAVTVERALFNHHGAKNRWRIGANVLRSFLEYFGTNTEQLDVYAEDGRAAFTSYTEKIMHGKGLDTVCSCRAAADTM